MKILIIGGTGFLGSRLVERLSPHHQVTVFHQGNTNRTLPTGVSELLGNRTVLESYRDQFSKIMPDLVIDVIPATKKHADGLINAVKGIAQRIVAISSCDVYKAYEIFLGRSQDSVQATPLKESSALRDSRYLLKEIDPNLLPAWLTPDYEKIQVEETLMNDPHIQGTIVRLPMIYGPGDVQKRFSEILGWQKEGKTITLDRATANWLGCWGYVDNVVEAICLAAQEEKAAGQIYHVADSRPKSYKEIVSHMANAAEWGGIIDLNDDPHTSLSTIFRIPSVNSSQNLNLDLTKITKDLGYKDIVSENEAFVRTFQWLSHS